MARSTKSSTWWRVNFLAGALLIFASIICARLVYWQVWNYRVLTAEAFSKRVYARHFDAQRGDIIDRNGHLLAASLARYELYVYPAVLGDYDRQAARLAPILELPPTSVREIISTTASFVLLTRDLSVERAEEVAAWDDMAIEVVPCPRRIYPAAELAAQVIGFVNEEPRGYYGLEEYYDEILRGSSVEQHGEQDFLGRQMFFAPDSFVSVHSGVDLVLTIDRTVQHIAERELQAKIAETGASGGSVIIMEPHTGAVWAMASYPTYDPNQFNRVAGEQPDIFVDPAVSKQYEPGSVFKIVTYAAALDSGMITPDTLFTDAGSLLVGGRIIENWDKNAYGEVTARDALAKSLNVVAAQLSTQLGTERFYDYVRRFGFGNRTGIDLANETPGAVHWLSHGEWREADLGTNSFGQGIAATPIQMTTALAAVANDGVLMKPYIVARIIDGDTVTETRPTRVGQVISPRTAQQLSEMLSYAVEHETTQAILPHHRVAGKTGTAQIPIPGGYDPKATIASFAGYVPADDPRFVMLVKIDRPQTSPWGAQVAAPLFRDVAQQVLDYLGVPPDAVRLGETRN